MNLPFGLDLKSVIITILVMYFLVPRIQAFLAARASAA